MGIKLPRPIDDNTERGKGGFDIPNGKYLLRVELCEEKSKKDSDDRYLNVELEIVDAENRKCEDAIGLKIFEKFSFTAESEWRLASFLDACFPPKFKGGDEIPDDIEGKRFISDVRMREYQGFSNPRCQSFKPPFNWRGEDLKTDAEGQEIGTVDNQTEKGDAAKGQAGDSKGGDEVVI
jgi:hypothetical protein